MNGLSDDILVAASQRGDKGAYAALAERYYKDVFVICLGVLGNVHDAEDIAQDAILKGFLKITKLRNNEQFSQWIFRIAKRLCIDFLRRQKYERAYRNKPAKHLQQATDENHELAEAIRRLPMEFRLPLVMYYFDNKSAKAIAEKLDISHSGACRRIRLARKQLHRLLTKEGES